MAGIPYFDLVIVDPQIDQIGGLAAQDHLVITGMLQFRRPKASHHGKGQQFGLGRNGGHNGSIAAGGQRAAQKTGAEYEQILGRKSVHFRGYPVPHYFGIGAQSSQIKLGVPGVGLHPLDIPPG